MYRGHYSLESLLLPRLLERESVWVDGREMSRQGLAEFLHRAHVHTHNKVLQSWEVSLFDCSAHQSLDMGAGMSDTGAEVKWEKVGLESESLEVWKAMVESFPNNNAKLTQHYCRKCPLFSPRPAGVHASPAPGLEKLENHAWHLHEPACDGGAICLAENCEFIQQTLDATSERSQQRACTRAEQPEVPLPPLLRPLRSRPRCTPPLHVRPHQTRHTAYDTTAFRGVNLSDSTRFPRDRR